MQRNRLLLILAAATLAPAASAGVVSYSIAPITPVAHPGDTGDAFQVLLSNNSGAPIEVTAFTFGVTTTDTDITFQSADFSTTPPYIFAGDSFDIFNSFPLSLSSPGQSLVGSDLTNDFAAITIVDGQTVGLGRVLYDVAPTAAAPGSFSIAFSTNAGDNSLSDQNFSAIGLALGSSQSVPITAVPEPAALLMAAAGLLVLLPRRRRR